MKQFILLLLVLVSSSAQAGTQPPLCVQVVSGVFGQSKLAARTAELISPTYRSYLNDQADTLEATFRNASTVKLYLVSSNVNLRQIGFAAVAKGTAQKSYAHQIAQGMKDPSSIVQYLAVEAAAKLQTNEGSRLLVNALYYDLGAKSEKANIAIKALQSRSDSYSLSLL